MDVFIDIDPEDTNKIKTTDFPYMFKPVIEKLPGASHRKGSWRFPFSWQAWLALSNAFQDKLVVGEQLSIRLNEEYNKFILPGYQLRQELDAEGYESLRDYQRAGVKFLSTIERGILADGLGSGKTRTSFSTVRRLYEEGKNPFPVLVVAPNSTKISWAREIEIVWPGLTVQVVDGTTIQRQKQLEKPAHVYVMNWESVRLHSRLQPYGKISLKRCEACGGYDANVKVAACEVHEKELNKIDFNTVIGDEIHRIMDPSSKVTRAFKAATGDAEFRYGLTGTPISSAPDNLYSILNWLRPEAYMSKTSFIDHFCIKGDNGWGGTIITGFQQDKMDEFFHGFDPFFRRMPKEVVLKDLPPVFHMQRTVPMGIKQKKAYNQMVKQMVAELDDDLLVEVSPLTKMIRLLQFASAYAEVEVVDFYDKKKEEWVKKNLVTLTDPSSKVDAFMDDLSDFGDESVVVFAVSKQLIDLLSARLTKAGISHGLITGEQSTLERQESMDKFQAGQIQFVLSTIAAGGTGITLTRGSTMVFLQRSWSMILNTQAEGRCHRIGSEQHDRIRVIDYITLGTVEEGVLEANEEKERQLEIVLRDKNFLKKLLLENKIDIPKEILATASVGSIEKEYEEELNNDD